MTDGPEVTPEPEATPKSAPTAPPAPTALPEGAVVLDKAEHDRIQAQLRRAEKALREREEADRKRTEEERAQAAKEAGEFDAALQAERAEKEQLRQKLAERDKRDALRDEIAKRGLTGSHARMLTKLADLAAIEDTGDGLDAAAAVDAVVGEYPDLFSQEEPAAEEPAPLRRKGPAPPRGTAAPFEGFLSPEDYARVPQDVRLTQDFQQRVTKSRPYWPKSFNTRNLPQSNE